MAIERSYSASEALSEAGGYAIVVEEDMCNMTPAVDTMEHFNILPIHCTGMLQVQGNSTSHVPSHATRDAESFSKSGSFTYLG
jgi:hypothetical protein